MRLSPVYPRSSSRAQARSCAVPLGVAIIGGLLVPQWLTPDRTPIAGLGLDCLAHRLRRARRKHPARHRFFVVRLFRR